VELIYILFPQITDYRKAYILGHLNVFVKNNKMSRLLFWTPRILSIIFIIFLAMFSLDIFDGHYGFWGTILGLLIHNIPALILLAVLIISWKCEIVGGIAFIAAGALYITILAVNAIRTPPFHWYYLAWSLTIAGPAFLIGIMFLIGWHRKKDKRSR
jgi:hypothetical protein